MPSVTVVSLLVVGVVVFFFLLIGLNGFTEAEGTRAILAYLVLLAVALVGGAWASHWSVRTLASRTNWSIWPSALVSIVASVMIVTVIIVLASLLVLVVTAAGR